MRSMCPALLAALLIPLAGFSEDAVKTESGVVFEAEPLLSNGVFERINANTPDKPAGWRSDAAAEAWGLDHATFLQGAAALRLTGGAPVSVTSDPVVLDADFAGLSVVAMGRGTGGAAKVRWLGHDGGILREDVLHALKAPESNGWTRHILGETTRPENAEQVVCVLEANAPAGESFWWDAVEITANYERKPVALVLINQAGYESFAPKHFVVSSNVELSGATFTVCTSAGRVVFKRVLGDSVRVTGADGADWGRNFYRGDFTPLNEEGNYTIQVKLGELEAGSPPFSLRFDQLWECAFNPAVQALAAYRNEGPGPLWNDPGKPALSDAEELWILVGGWSALQWKLDLSGGVSPLTDEVRRASPRAAKRIESAAAGTLPYWSAALSRYARREGTDTAALEAAKQAVAALKTAGGKAEPLAFSAAWDLYSATGDAAWKDQATAWFPGVNIDAIEPLLEYESDGGPLLSLEVARAMEQMGDTLLKRARNPFGVYTTEDKGKFCYLLPSSTEPEDTPQGMGNTHRVLMAAEIMAKAYRFAPKPEYLEFIYDQLNWVFGCNPAGVCLMEGVGAQHVAKIAGPGADRRDTLSGVILNGIGPVAPGDDRPLIALKESDTATEATNGFALRNNMRFIGAMAQLKRIRTVQPREK